PSEIGSQRSIRRRAADGVTRAAARRQKQISTLPEERCRRLGCVSDLLSKPALVFRLRHGDHVEGHQRMLITAVFGALSAVDARARSRKRISVCAPRDHVELAGEARYPEAVNDILRLENEFDGRIYWDPDLVCGGERRVALAVEIIDAPPELLPDHLDAYFWIADPIHRP